MAHTYLYIYKAFVLDNTSVLCPHPKEGGKPVKVYAERDRARFCFNYISNRNASLDQTRAHATHAHLFFTNIFANHLCVCFFTIAV